jgi:hypothetical protein
MHWSLMIRFWGEELLRANPGLDERLLVRTLLRRVVCVAGTSLSLAAS